MSTKKTAKSRESDRLGPPRPEPRPRLPKPPSECSTTDLVAALPEEVTELLRGRKRRRESVGKK